MLYLLFILLCFRFSYLYDGNVISPLKINYRPYWFLCIFLIFIAGLRYMNGGDTHNYYSFFLESRDLESLTERHFSDSRYQPGFILLVAFCKSLGNSFVVQQIVEALFINIILFKFIKKNCSAPYIAVLMYFILNYFEYNMEVMRESMAIGFGVLMYLALEKKKYVFTIIFFMLAYSMHVSALILAFFPFLMRVRYNKKFLVLVLALAVLVPFIYISIPNITYYISIIFNQEDWVVEAYSQQEFGSDLNFNYYIKHEFVWLIVPLYIITYLNKKGYDKFTGFIYSFVLLHVLGMISYAFYRFANYLAPFWWIVLAEFLIYIYKEKRIRQTLFTYSLTVFILLYLYQSVQLFYDAENKQFFYERYIPYQTVIFNSDSY